MSDIRISARAYIKMIFHAAKYPHCAVNGILLATKDSLKSKNPYITEIIPLFHQCLYVSPMTEIALVQIETIATDSGLQIAGYYAASENFYANTIEKAPCPKIADKIAENLNTAYFVIIQNNLVTLDMCKPAIKLWQHIDGNWNEANFSLENSDITLDAVAALLKRGAMKDFNDFDNYLDDTENDWLNEYLNRDLQQIMAMY